MDFDTDLLSELQDSEGEIFDLVNEINSHNEFKRKDFDFNEYLNANYDY